MTHPDTCVCFECCLAHKAEIKNLKAQLAAKSATGKKKSKPAAVPTSHAA